ncbi:MAG TPA: hypothetical protein VN892_10290 [Solirubrobacteraceae bacterium]|nr:hypothetical protein [Solirubrobacteraceae bacterium]
MKLRVPKKGRPTNRPRDLIAAREMAPARLREGDSTVRPTARQPHMPWVEKQCRSQKRHITHTNVHKK